MNNGLNFVLVTIIFFWSHQAHACSGSAVVSLSPNSAGQNMQQLAHTNPQVQQVVALERFNLQLIDRIADALGGPIGSERAVEATADLALTLLELNKAKEMNEQAEAEAAKQRELDLWLKATARQDMEDRKATDDARSVISLPAMVRP